MSPDERRLLTDLFERIRTASANPRDREAEAFIAEAVRDMPYAPYLLAQAVLVQDEALKSAGARIEALERDLAGRDESDSGSFLGRAGSLFGSRPTATEDRQPPAGGPWSHQRASVPSTGRSGWGAPQGGDWQAGAGTQTAPPQAAGQGGFLKGALGAAAGVAGGVLLANSLQGLFGGGHGGEHGGRGILGDQAGAQKSGDTAGANAAPDGNVDDWITGGAFDKASHDPGVESHDDGGWSDGDGGDYDV